MRIVLDTNCLLRVIPPGSKYRRVWDAFTDMEYTLCVSNEILEEYEEIISSHASPIAASVTVEEILKAHNVLRVDVRFRFGLIEADPDDNKFVDCAIVSNAKYIVSDDRHFDVLRDIPFPHVDVVRLEDFAKTITP